MSVNIQTNISLENTMNTHWLTQEWQNAGPTFHAIVDCANGEIVSSHSSWDSAEAALNSHDGPEPYEIWLAGERDKLLFPLTSIEAA